MLTDDRMKNWKATDNKSADRRGQRFNNCLIICYHPRLLLPFVFRQGRFNDNWTSSPKPAPTYQMDTDQCHRLISWSPRHLPRHRPPNLSSPRQALPCIPYVRLKDHFFASFSFLLPSHSWRQKWLIARHKHNTCANLSDVIIISARPTSAINQSWPQFIVNCSAFKRLQKLQRFLCKF